MAWTLKSVIRNAYLGRWSILWKIDLGEEYIWILAVHCGEVEDLYYMLSVLSMRGDPPELLQYIELVIGLCSGRGIVAGVDGRSRYDMHGFGCRLLSAFP
jgi:hypothetical protein